MFIKHKSFKESAIIKASGCERGYESAAEIDMFRDGERYTKDITRISIALMRQINCQNMLYKVVLPLIEISI